LLKAPKTAFHFTEAHSNDFDEILRTTPFRFTVAAVGVCSLTIVRR